MTNNTLDIALDFVKANPADDVHLFPIRKFSKTPPSVEDNLDKGASNDPKQFQEWSRRWPQCNWGIALKLTNWLVVDVDNKPGKVGEATYDDLDLQYGWPKTRTVLTPSGGCHLYFRGTHAFGLGKYGFGSDIDSPNYVLVPGCTLKGGGSYRDEDASVPIADVPSWFYEFLKKGTDEARDFEASQDPLIGWDSESNIAWAIHFLLHDAPASVMGQAGDKTCVDTAGVLKDHGISEPMCQKLMAEHYNDGILCDPVWDLSFHNKNGLFQRIRSAYRYLTGSRPGAATAEHEFASHQEEPLDDKAKKAGEREEKRQERKKENAKTFGFEYVLGSDIKLKKLEWIWDGHLALGQHTCIAGVQGDGKSQLVYALAAAVTTGGEWPGTKQRAPLGRVVILNAEDTTDDVLGPRLVAAGADMSRVIVIKATKNEKGKRKFNLQADVANLTQLARSLGDVKLISFDPVSSYLGGTLDSHENVHLRDALDPITGMAEATGAAVISVTHFNKSSKGVNVLNRVMGGAGFTAAPRAAFAVIRDADDKDVRLFLPIKLNLMTKAEAYGLRFTIEMVTVDKKKDIRAPHIVWGRTTEITADEALIASQEMDGADGPAMTEAKEFLKVILADGPVLATEIEAEAKGRNISMATLRRARIEIGEHTRKVRQTDGHGPWMWSLEWAVPPGCNSDFPEDRAGA